MHKLEVKGHLFKIKKVAPVHKIDNVKSIRIKSKSDLVLKKNNQYYFVQHVPEANVIEYIENTSVKVH